MTVETEIASLTQSTTNLLNAVNTSKATLDDKVDLAEAAATSATTQAANAASSASAASSSASSASSSASAASASAASASAIVTGVATGMPSVRPSLNLDFVNSKTVDPRINFTRSTTATYYDGKTTAKAEENLMTYSGDIAGSTWSSWTNVTVTEDADVAPDGTTSANLIDFTSGSSSWTYNNDFKPTAGKTYTFSVWAKAGTSAPSVDFVSFTGVLTQGGTFTPTSTWTRYTWTKTFTSGGGNGTGLRCSGTSGDAYFWGFQVEERDSITAYTPTTTSPITNYIPVLQTAAINEPRLDHDPVTGEAKGLLIEESRTNLFPYSRTFGGFSEASFSGPNATLRWLQSDVAIAPDGTQTATKLIESTSYDSQRMYWAGGPAVTAEEPYTWSVYAKAGERQYLVLNATEISASMFNLHTGEIYATASGVITTMASIGNGWYRCSITYSPSTTSTVPWISVMNEALQTSYEGDGFSGIYIWGAQFEKGSFPTSYIPTSGASVTRAKDGANITTDKFDYESSEGSFVIKADSAYAHGIGGSCYLLYIDAPVNDMFLYRHGGGTSYRLGGTNVSMYFTPSDVGAEHVIAFGFKGNTDIELTADGSVIATDNSYSAPVGATNLLLFGLISGNQYNGWIKDFVYYPKRLPSSELQAVTNTL